MRAIARSEESLSGGEEGEMEKQGLVDDILALHRKENEVAE